MSEFQKLRDHLDKEEGVELTHQLPPSIDLEALFWELQEMDAKAHQYDEIAHTLRKEGIQDLRYNLHGNVLQLLNKEIDIDRLRERIWELEAEKESLEQEVYDLEFDTYLCEECGEKVC